MCTNTISLTECFVPRTRKNKWMLSVFTICISGASLFVITLHAVFYNIDIVLNTEDERIDLMMEEV